MKSKAQSETSAIVVLVIEKKNVLGFVILTSFDIWILKFGFKNSIYGLSISGWGNCIFCLHIFVAKWFRADH